MNLSPGNGAAWPAISWGSIDRIERSGEIVIEDPTPTVLRDAGGVRAASEMDCIQVNLGVLADRFHGTDTHLRLGAPLRFDVRPLDSSPGALPTVEPELDERLESAGRLLGLTTRERDAGDLTGGPLYAVADA